MNGKIIFRIILDILIILCVIQGWWFVALPLALIGVWKCGTFIEIIIAGIMYDSLFGFVKGTGLWAYAGTGASVIIFAIAAFLKGTIRK
jgi:hypothetical protein